MGFNINIVHDSIIVQMNEDNLYNKDFNIELSKEISHIEFKNIIFDLSNIKIIDSSNIKTIEKSIKFFILHGKKAILCGLNTIAISSFIHFVDDFEFDSYLDVQSALDAL